MESEIENTDLFDKKAARAFRTIAEVSVELNVSPSALRFWEKKFPAVSPVQRPGGRRYYRPEDIALLKKIEYLLRDRGYTVKGVQKLIEDGTINSAVEQQSGLPSVQTGEKSVENKAELENVIAELEEIAALLKKVI